MRIHLSLPAAALTVLLSAPLGSCQRYEFEEITPKAIAVHNAPTAITGKKREPKMMLVVDASGSMKTPDAETCNDYTDPMMTDDPPCCTTNEYTVSDPFDPGSPNPCKWKDLRAAFLGSTGFLETARKKALFGLMVFPNYTPDKFCQPGVVLPGCNIPSAPEVNIETIKTELGQVMPNGGTPIAPTLMSLIGNEVFMRDDPGRDKFVLLLTDGSPNCNPSNQTRCLQCLSDPGQCIGPSACYKDSSRPIFECSYPEDPDYNPLPWFSCHDGANTVGAVQELRNRGVYTFVIGFGGLTAVGDAKVILDAAAIAGGKARAGDPKYYQANNLAELTDVLNRIVDTLQTCNFSLDPVPANPDMVQVKIRTIETGEEVVLQRDVEWRFTSMASLNTVEILGDRCTQLQYTEAGKIELLLLYAAPL